MKTLVINAGSSSIKFQVFEMPEEKVLVSANFERIGLDNSFYSLVKSGEKIKKEAVLNNHLTAINIFLEELISNQIVSSLEEIKTVGHRVVHGSSKYKESIIIDNQVMEDIKSFSDLAPLHNPANLLGIQAVKTALPNAINVAVFDTAFHQTMPKESFIYPVPYEWYEQYGVRKYGFHGVSHHYVSLRIAELENKQPKIIICHLGNGASISAVKEGKCLNTSMGFTPISGIAMGTRCGDIDPSIIPYIMQKTNKSINEIMDDLNKKSGMLGMSQISSDAREIETAINEGNEKAILAQKIYIQKIVSFISYYHTLLGGAEVIAFTAGIGEKDKKVRKEIMEMLKPLGVVIDYSANDVKGVETVITTEESKIKCYIIPTNEELMIGKETYRLSI
jgi:acetate kinase